MANLPIKINDDSDADKYYIIEDNKIYHRSRKDSNYNLDLTGYKPVRSAFKNYLKENNISDITKPSINNISESTDAVESNNIVEPTNTPETDNNVESVVNVIPKTSNSTDIRNMFNIEQKVHYSGSFGVPAKNIMTNDNKSNITEPLIVQGITSSSHTPKSKPITKQLDNDRLIEILKNNMDEDDKPDEPLNIQAVTSSSYVPKSRPVEEPVKESTYAKNINSTTVSKLNKSDYTYLNKIADDIKLNKKSDEEYIDHLVELYYWDDIKKQHNNKPTIKAWQERKALIKELSYYGNTTYQNQRDYLDKRLNRKPFNKTEYLKSIGYYDIKGDPDFETYEKNSNTKQKNQQNNDNVAKASITDNNSIIRKPMYYKSDTVMTPNIRTVNDSTYLKGHSLTNDKLGIVLHHTASDANSAITTFTQKGSDKSAHVVIKLNGDRVVMANDDDVTFHAGISRFNGRDWANDFMLGVEFEGNTLKKPLTENQIKSAAEFIIPKMIKYGWTINDITNHTTVNKQWDEYREQRIKETGDDRQSPKKDDVTQKNLDAVKKYIAEHYNEYFDK